MPLYREFTTQAELDLQYDPERWVGDQTAFTRVIEGRQPLVERAKAEARAIADVPYGPTLIEKLDIYPATTPKAPVYWRQLSFASQSAMRCCRRANQSAQPQILRRLSAPSSTSCGATVPFHRFSCRRNATS